MEAEFSEDEEAWLKYGLITDCVEPDLEYFSDEEIEALPDIARQDRGWQSKKWIIVLFTLFI